MFSRMNFVRMPHDGWMKIDPSLLNHDWSKWMKIVAFVIGRLLALMFVKKTPRALFLP